MDGVFGLLTNVVWTNLGPCAVAGFESTRARLRAAGHHVTVYGVDKFPRMVDYVLPTGVRVADADRVRLGAHLAEGTTVMHEGFVNYNAGTLGASMVEGRISAGVLVGDGSDVGGGASIMGTLSGGGTEVISVGERCLLGANSGLGISLGDDCVVEAGCYVTAGTKVTVLDMDGKPKVIKAAELSGASNVLFRRNSVTRNGRGRGLGERPDRPQRRPARELTPPVVKRGLIGLGVLALVAVAVTVFVGLRVFDRVGPLLSNEGCEARVGGHSVSLTLEQSENVALMAAISVQRGMPARAATIAIATSAQESKLYNIEHGDRDSLGLFQQRPSQGWGTPGADPQPLLLDQRVLRRPGEGRGLRVDGDHRGGTAGPAVRLPGRLRPARGRRPGPRLRADRQLPARRSPVSSTTTGRRHPTGWVRAG